MTAPEKIHGLVLAGGRSRRMGSDKAALVSDGETLWVYSPNQKQVIITPDLSEQSQNTRFVSFSA